MNRGPQASSCYYHHLILPSAPCQLRLLLLLLRFLSKRQPTVTQGLHCWRPKHKGPGPGACPQHPAEMVTPGVKKQTVGTSWDSGGSQHLGNNATKTPALTEMKVCAGAGSGTERNTRLLPNMYRKTQSPDTSAVHPGTVECPAHSTELGESREIEQGRSPGTGLTT